LLVIAPAGPEPEEAPYNPPRREVSFFRCIGKELCNNYLEGEGGSKSNERRRRLKLSIIYSKYFPNSDWLKAHA